MASSDIAGPAVPLQTSGTTCVLVPPQRATVNRWRLSVGIVPFSR